MELIDTHCHLDATEFKETVGKILAGAKSANITTMILPGVVQNGWREILTLCRENTALSAAPGLHPLYLSQHQSAHLEELEMLARQGKLVAIGEIGLDYHNPGSDKNSQQLLFEQQLHIAQRTTLPILLHVRKAHDQVLATLRRKRFPNGGIVHAFSGSYQQASQYITLGFGIGFGGTLTYGRAKRIRATATQLPEETIVLETDAPYMPPAHHKKEINKPEYLPEILTTLATLRNESPEYTAQYTTANARRILNLAKR